jgi:PhnB protein
MSAITYPEGYNQVMPYLIVKNAEAFFDFMQNVFGAIEKMKVMRDATTVMHAELQIGDSTIMYCDATENFPSQTAGLFVYVADCDAAYQRAITAGATSIMAPVDQEYGRGAGVRDAFGNTWWITSVL